MTARSQKNEPALRFKDDDGRDYPDWENNFLGELFEINAGGDIQKTHLRKTRDSVFCYPVYANAENLKGLHGYSDRYRVSKDCITVSGRGVGIGIAHARFEKFYPIVRLLVLHPKNACNLMFFEYAINELRIFNESTGVPQLTSPQLKTYRINFPDVGEQQKIASFLSAVDTKIEQLNRKKSLLEQYKKGMMHKLFSREIRFKDEDGRDYRDYENTNLGCLAKLSSGKSLSKNIDSEGENFIIDMGSISSDGKLIPTKRTKLNENFLRIGQLVMPKDDIGGGNIIGRVGFINENEKYILADHVYLLDVYACDSLFLSYLINHAPINKSFRRKANGTAQLGLARKAVLEQSLSIPQSLEEQQKIADFLSTIDRKIELVAGQIKQTRYFKQGLLQQMFI